MLSVAVGTQSASVFQSEVKRGVYIHIPITLLILRCTCGVITVQLPEQHAMIIIAMLLAKEETPTLRVTCLYLLFD